MPRIKLILAYIGTAYHGWQTQKNDSLPTVQNELVKAIFKISQQNVILHGSGRTDSGVHAECQVVHFDIEEKFSRVNWQLALNTMLPKDIRVKSAELCNQNFHARYNAVKKIYTYSLWQDKNYVPPRIYPFVHESSKLDIDLMQQAASFLIGTHDFASFQNTGTELKTSVRTIYYINFEKESDLMCHVYLCADGFLKQMVRNIMGLLLNVGSGKICLAEVKKTLEFKDRNLASANAPTAPAKALCLKEVFY